MEDDLYGVYCIYTIYSRNVQVLAKDMLRYYEYQEDVDEEEIEEILDMSIMSADEQQRRRLWTLPLCERPTITVCKVDPDYHRKLYEESKREEERNHDSPTSHAKMEAFISGKIERRQQLTDNYCDSNIFDLQYADAEFQQKMQQLKRANTLLKQVQDAEHAKIKGRSSSDSEASNCLPVAIYDVDVFIDVLVELLMELDKERYQ